MQRLACRRPACDCSVAAVGASTQKSGGVCANDATGVRRCMHVNRTGAPCQVCRRAAGAGLLPPRRQAHPQGGAGALSLGVIVDCMAAMCTLHAGRMAVCVGGTSSLRHPCCAAHAREGGTRGDWHLLRARRVALQVCCMAQRCCRLTPNPSRRLCVLAWGQQGLRADQPTLAPSIRTILPHLPRPGCATP